MAKISSIQKNDRRRRLNKKYAERRIALKKIISQSGTDPDERETLCGVGQTARNSFPYPPIVTAAA